MQKGLLCLFQLLLSSNAAVPTVINEPHLKQMPIGKKNLPGYKYIKLFILVEKNLGLKKQRAND